MSNVIDFQQRQKPTPKETGQAAAERIEELEAENARLWACFEVVGDMIMSVARDRHPSSATN